MWLEGGLKCRVKWDMGHFFVDIKLLVCQRSLESLESHHSSAVGQPCLSRVQEPFSEGSIRNFEKPSYLPLSADSQ